MIRPVDVRVSVHYYIDKRGRVTQMVDDADTAWHAGLSKWTVDGKPVAGDSCNPISVGIELENRNTGRDPYPDAQYAATLELTRDLVKRHNIPRSQLVRHLDISPGRKTDPAAFPWARFVNEVYNAPIDGATDQLGANQRAADQRSADQQLRAQLIDLAYRAAHAGAPAGWPLLKASVSRGTGMPVATLSTPPPEGDTDGQDQPNRPLLLSNQPPLIAELFGRDLYYAQADALDQADAVKSWSATPSGELRHLLAVAMFAKADPAQGFHPEWPIHQAFLGRIADTGTPLGPLHRITTPGGRVYQVQHFAVDSLCSPSDQPDTIVRLNDLTHEMYAGDPHAPAERELRTLLLDDLYRARTGRAFERGALFCRFAIRNRLGAPLAKAEPLTVAGAKCVAMPYALDVLFCRVPADGNWDNVSVGVLAEGDDDGLALLSSLLAEGVIDEDLIGPPETLGGPGIDELLPDMEYNAGVLGATVEEPAMMVLSGLDPAKYEPRGDVALDSIVVYPTGRSLMEDLADATAADAAFTPHYYVTQDGTITQLIDEHYLTHGVPQGAIGVAVEGATGGSIQVDSPQAVALAWLLHDIVKRNGLQSDQIVQSADYGEPISDAWNTIRQGA